MTMLTARVTALRERLVQVDEMTAKVGEAAALEDLRADLKRKSDTLAPALTTQALLAAAGATIAAPASVEQLRTRAADLLQKFRAEPAAATLKRGQSWQQMLNQVGTAAGELDVALAKSWTALRADAFPGDPPAVVRKGLAHTKANDEVFAAYSALYQQFQATRDLPRDAAAIEQARRLGARLKEAAAKFDRDVPPEVKVFLDAAQSLGGAPLALLTAQVKAWLEEKQCVDDYRIKVATR